MFLPAIVVTVFNAIALAHEVTVPVPSVNDDAYHYLVVQRAADALANGENILDHWNYALELGFPTLLYYQHLPHLVAVGLREVLLQSISTLDAFNLVRYLLMVTLPVTVYWSMRRLGFSQVASALGAAAAPLLSGNFRYGFDYDSYTWRGFGLYTQLFGMHLSFLTLACLNTTIRTGKGKVTSVLWCSAMVLSHFIYSYIMAVNTAVMFLLGLTRRNLRLRVVSLAFVAGLTGVICAYALLSFMRGGGLYLNASPYLQPYKYDSFGLDSILGWLVKGELMDHGRLPVLTALLGLGVLASVWQRTQPQRLFLVLLAVWLIMYAGRETWGSLADLAPLGKDLLYHRFIGGVEIAAIPLIGVGAEVVWRLASRLPVASAAIATVIAVVLFYPALEERREFYSLNETWMKETRASLEQDADGRALLDQLKALPPGRTFAGLRNDAWKPVIANHFVSFPDRLTFEQIDAVSSPYGGLSLMSDLIWDFDASNHVHYRLFNVRYVVLPAVLPKPDFLNPVAVHGRYTLYRVNFDNSYFAFGGVPFAAAGGRDDFHAPRRAWFQSTLPSRNEYPAVALKGGPSAPAGLPTLDLRDTTTEVYNGLPPSVQPASARIQETLAQPERHAALITVTSPGYAVLKVTYHPQWRAYVDGQRVDTYHVMPGYVAAPVPAGTHTLEFLYEPAASRTWLSYLSLTLVVGLIGWQVVTRRGPPPTGDTVA